MNLYIVLPALHSILGQAVELLILASLLRLSVALLLIEA